MAVAYAGTFHSPFLLDDAQAILQNATILHPADLARVLSPPAFTGVSGRPLLNLTYALNYAWGGFGVAGYHAFNLAVHIAAALALFGLVRRTVASSPRTRRIAAAADDVALGGALLWALHPLVTGAVTYISERAESLMGLGYLLTFYTFVRLTQAATAGSRRRWAAASVVCCIIGAGVKEVMVTAPLLVLVFDAVFWAGGARAALRRRRAYYGALFLAGWGAVGAMLASGRHAIGFHRSVGTGEYVFTECRAVAQYLRLAFWPHPLVFDYGPVLALPSPAVLVCAVAIAALLAATGYALRRTPAVGFLGVWVFVILAPTSTFVPIALQPIAESRMYLPLAAIAVGAAAAGFRLLGRRRGRWAVLGLATALGGAALARNAQYRSELSIWSDTVAKRPRNPRAQDYLGNALAAAGRPAAAIPCFRAALALTPKVGRIHYDFARALAAAGERREAAAEFARATRLDPTATEPGNALGAALFREGRPEAALEAFEQVLRADPANPAAHNNLGNVLLALHRTGEAQAQFAEAVRLAPNYAEAYRGLGLADLEAGDAAGARTSFESAVRLEPNDAEARLRLGNLLAMGGRVAEAMEQWRICVRLRPGDAEAHNNLATGLAQEGLMPDAIREYEAALRIDPSYAEARNNLAQLRAAMAASTGAR